MKSRVILVVTGKNINNFILRLHKNNIDILNIKNINYKKVEIETYYNNYEEILKLKTIYNIEIKRYKGLKYYNNKIIFNRYIILSLFLGIILFTVLSNIILNINIIYTGKNMRELLESELRKYGIKKYNFSKSYNELEQIKNNIINDNKDKIEWLEIERKGVAYNIRVEPRKTNNIDNDSKIYNIVSNKDAIIKNIELNSGEIIHNINSYVKKDELIISSDITLNGEVKNIISAKGKIYGEVWYQVKFEYPLNYYEEKETGNKKELLTLKILNYNFNIGSFKNKKEENKIILRNNILPFMLVKQQQKEIEIINRKLQKKEAVSLAITESRNKMQSNLSKDEYIISEKSLKIDMKESKIILDMFYTVYEDITKYVERE